MVLQSSNTTVTKFLRPIHTHFFNFWTQFFVKFDGNFYGGDYTQRYGTEIFTRAYNSISHFTLEPFSTKIP